MIAIFTVWAYHFFNRLWQQSLQEEAQDAIATAARLGLAPKGPLYGPRVVYTGTIGATPVRVEWRGGLRGARTILRRGEHTERLPLITTADALHAVLPAEG